MSAVLNDSGVNTLEVPIVGDNPATLTHAANVPMRVVVRNIGGGDVLISYDAAVFKVQTPQAQTFKIPPGESEVFVLNIKQGLYAAGVGGPGSVCIAWSDAFPAFRLES